MQIYHPAQNALGLPAENVFCVADSSGQARGDGWISPAFYPNLFPERSLNIYLCLNAEGGWRDALLGCLLARTYQIKQLYPSARARLFTHVKPADRALQEYFAKNGFDMDDRRDVVRLSMPDIRAAAPMGYNLSSTPLNTQTEMEALIGRMNRYRLNAWKLPYLQSAMNFPHFLSLSLEQGATIVGEAVFTGNGKAAKLLGLYILPEYRRRGLAQCLIAIGMNRLYSNGVQFVDTDFIVRSELQRGLINACNASFVSTVCYYPGVDYD